MHDLPIIRIADNSVSLSVWLAKLRFTTKHMREIDKEIKQGYA